MCRMEFLYALLAQLLYKWGYLLCDTLHDCLSEKQTRGHVEAKQLQYELTNIV